MQYPTAPSCHKDAHRVLPGPVTWRTPSEDRPFRTCSYCGSIHPEDLVRALEVGARLGGSDWKYGWPHKFYVYGIPNPTPDVLELRMSTREGVPADYQLTEQEKVEGWRLEPQHSPEFASKVLDKYAPQGPTRDGKWYNEHLLDVGYDDTAFEQLTQLLFKHSGIQFVMIEGKLQYSAPHFGYQRM